MGVLRQNWGFLASHFVISWNFLGHLTCAKLPCSGIDLSRWCDFSLASRQAWIGCKKCFFKKSLDSTKKCKKVCVSHQKNIQHPVMHNKYSATCSVFGWGLQRPGQCQVDWMIDQLMESVWLGDLAVWISHFLPAQLWVVLIGVIFYLMLVVFSIFTFTQYVHHVKDMCAYIYIIIYIYLAPDRYQHHPQDFWQPCPGPRAICRSCAFWWNGIALLTSQLLGEMKRCLYGAMASPLSCRWRVNARNPVKPDSKRPSRRSHCRSQMASPWISKSDIIIQWHALFVCVLVLDFFSYSTCKRDPLWQASLSTGLKLLANITF